MKAILVSKSGQTKTVVFKDENAHPCKSFAGAQFKTGQFNSVQVLDQTGAILLYLEEGHPEKRISQ